MGNINVTIRFSDGGLPFPDEREKERIAKELAVTVVGANSSLRILLITVESVDRLRKIVEGGRFNGKMQIANCTLADPNDRDAVRSILSPPEPRYSPPPQKKPKKSRTERLYAIVFGEDEQPQNGRSTASLAEPAFPSS